MPEYLSISKHHPDFPDYLDFQALRRIGIDRVQQLSSKLWTDYNLHDPGVTILEVLCYAITDLGYRNNFEIEDLLALNLKDANSQENNFFTPDRLLTCNPVTELDFRKRLIDIPGVRNAWLQRLGVVDSDAVPSQTVENYQPAIYVDRVNGRLQYQPLIGQSEQTALRLNPKGLYRVCLDLEPDRVKDACGESYRSWAGILDEVKRVLCSYRNLCEDFEDVTILGEEEIGLCTEIELAANADPEDVLVEIYVRVQAFLAPQLRFYTLAELLDRGQSPAEIFAGRPSALYDATTVYHSNGFIDPAELAALTPPQTIHTSDLYQIIMDVSGVAAIQKLSIVNYINGLPQSAGDPWCLHLSDKHRPVLGIARSRVTFYKGNLPFKAAAAEVERRYYEQQAAGIKSPRDRSELDLAVPQGTYAELADHYSIHHDFPLTYGISEDGLPGTTPALRQGQANQLKGYLIFFDQILANYLAQLAHVRDLFSWESEQARQKPIDEIWQQNRQRTYFTQALTNLPGVEEIVRNYRRCSGTDLPGEMPLDYIAYLDRISENLIAYLDRRNRFLDHLLGRFAESFSDYVQLNYRLDGGRRGEIDIIENKARFLREYPDLSRDRFRAVNYCNCDRIWDTNNVSGFQKRVSRLLGMDIDPLTDRQKLWQRSLNHYQIIPTPGGFRFSLAIDAQILPLESKQIYATREEAQAALDEFLVFALNPAHYQRLAYSSYYHYSWEVTDETGKTLVTYDRQFPSQSARNAILELLLEDLAGGKAIALGLETDTAGLVSLKLTIAVPDKLVHTFTSVQKYAVEADAIVAAETTQRRMQERGAYRGMQIGAATGSPERFTHYGYGAIDPHGNLWAESAERFATIDLRDRHLQRWLSSLQSNQNKLEIVQAIECFWFEIKDRNGNRTLLRGIQGVSTPAAAQSQVTQVLTQGQTRDVYELTDLTDAFSFNLQLPAGSPFARHPQTYPTAIERNLRLDALLYYLKRLTPQPRITGEEGNYRVTLLDRDGNSLLITANTYSTQAQATAAYQRLLYLAADPVYFQPINDLPGLSCGFELVDRRGQIFATHPQSYRTSCQRDLMIRGIINYVNQEIDRRLVNRETGIYYELRDRAASPLLVGAIAYEDITAATAAFEQMLILARSRTNYQLIDNAPGDCPFSFALSDGTTRLATHPDRYATAVERDQALQALINLVTCDAPLYRIDGTEGHFSYALVDLLADPVNPPTLLTSVRTYPDPEMAEAAFRQMLPFAALPARYRRIDTLPTPQPFGLELLDAEGTLIAHHLNGEGNPLGYATENEREAAIAKIGDYAAQSEIRSVISNEEGAFFAEVREKSGTPIWIGRRIFPDRTAAAAEAERICNLARQADRYVRIDRGIGKCPYSFVLIDEQGVEIADYRHFYQTTASRDRQIAQLWRQFGGAAAFLTIREDIPGEFTFEIPAELLCLFQECLPQQLAAFQSGAILRSPQGETFPTAAAARAAFLQRLPLALDDRHLVRDYHNQACTFSFNLQAATHRIVATSQLYHNRQDMETAIAFIQQIARGFSVTKATPGTCCSYYFYLEIPNAAKTQFQSLNRYPTEERAWQAAGAFTEHLRYLHRYTIQSPGLGITDRAGNLIAVTDVELDRVEVFTLLNTIEPLLQIESIPGASKRKIAGYRFKLHDRLHRQGEILLVGSQSQADETAARSHFYSDVLSILFESGAIEPTGSNPSSPFSFQVVDPQMPTQILATHPQNYPAAAQRDKAIERLKLLIRTARLLIDTPAQPPANVGRITDATGKILLQEIPRDRPNPPEHSQTAACQSGNTLVELAQTQDNFRSIDDEDGNCTYSWELTNRSKDRILAVPLQTFSTSTERDRSIAAIQQRIDDEGFHLVEHILLRPKHQPQAAIDSGESGDPLAIGDNFLPIAKDSSSTNAPVCVAAYDPYSFWISVILPYWPTRFRNLNFRQLVERTLRLEAPAHVGLKICWIDVCQMQEFETAYRDWLEQLTLDACQGAACDLTGSLNRLIDILSRLNNIYPEGTLHDCIESDPNDNPIVLNRTALRTGE